MSKDYHEQQNIKLTIRIRNILNELPAFLSEYFRGINETTSPNTRMVYGYDLRNFFNYLLQHSDHFQSKTMKAIIIDDLNYVSPEDIERYLEYLTYYTTENKNGDEVSHKNFARGKSKKLSAIKAMFRYFIRKRKIKVNPAELVDMPKIHEKNITRLEKDEVIKLIKGMETGDNLTKTQKNFHAHNKNRDLAIIILLLGTGLRISELIGINLEHIDFKINGIKITRKGGNEVVIYFGDEVSNALKTYLLEREHKVPLNGHEDALFLSMQNKRITARAIQNLVKKHSQALNSFKNISPHKLRSTYGTNLYRATRDIYLVADVLGHRDVNTTRKHYAQMDDERRKSAANYVKIKE